MKQFIITGWIRLFRLKSDFLLLFFWPMVTILIIRLAGIANDYFLFIILVSLGMQAAVTIGYDYGRAHETGILYRFLITGMSPFCIFIGINFHRIAAYFLSGMLYVILGLTAGIKFQWIPLIFMLSGGIIVFSALGLFVYRIIRSSLGVLSSVPIAIIFLSLPLYSGNPGIFLISPISAFYETAVHPSLISAVAGIFWIFISIIAILILVIRRK